MAFCLAVLVALDGLLTGMGLAQLGIGMEGNALVRSMLVYYGQFEGLMLLKTLSVGLVLLLAFLPCKERVLSFGFNALGLAYFGLAVVPWTLVLASNA